MSQKYSDYEIKNTKYNNLCVSCKHINLNEPRIGYHCMYDCSKKGWVKGDRDSSSRSDYCYYYSPNGKIKDKSGNEVYMDYDIVDYLLENGGSYNSRLDVVDSNPCYITTIVTKLLGLGDNNELLNTLRLFRRNTLQTNPSYKNLLMEYDIVGPVIADCIENDRELYDINVLEKYIRYCVSLVKQGKETEAVTIYTNMVNMLKEIFNISFEQVKCDNYDYTVGGHGYVKNR